MVYVCGDLHGDQNQLAMHINNYKFDKNDILIVLGDFGFIFRNTYTEDRFLDDFQENMEFTLAFLSGNHENHPVIAQYPIEEKWGGRVRKIRNNIFNLLNGEIYDFGENKKAFVMGGAYSIDKASRIKTQWLQSDGEVFSKKFEKNENQDCEIITDRDFCYEYIFRLYDSLRHLVKAQIPDFYGEYSKLRYSNKDQEKNAKVKAIDNLLPVFYGNDQKDFSKILYDLYKEMGGKQKSFCLKFIEGTWWEEELPKQEDYENAWSNLEKNNMQVDYILSHTMPREIIARYMLRTRHGHFDAHDLQLTVFLENVMFNCQFKKHYFGHWHDDMEITAKHTAVYFDVHSL